MSDMDTSPIHQIAGLKPGPDYVLNVIWEDGSAMTVNMRGLMREGTAFAPLKDPDLFATVRIAEHRQSIEWPDPIDSNEIMVDYHADSLYRRGETQRHSSLMQWVGAELRKLFHAAPSQEPT